MGGQNDPPDPIFSTAAPTHFALVAHCRTPSFTSFIDDRLTAATVHPSKPGRGEIERNLPLLFPTSLPPSLFRSFVPSLARG